jgi:iron complex transport system ATP-binding protein
MNAIEVYDLTFGYGQGAVLADLSFQVRPGLLVGIAGPNGAGKTTLLNLLCGLLRAQAGRVIIDALPIEAYSIPGLARKIAIVHQEFVPVFDFTVAETVMMARTVYLRDVPEKPESVWRWLGPVFESQADRQIVAEALQATEVAHLAARNLGELSSGERQRVFIARALAQQTPILLLDEPTSFLDLKYQVGIYDLLKQMQLEKGKTILAVSHDVNLAAQYCDEVLLLGCAGSFQMGTPRDVLSCSQLEKFFAVQGFSGPVGCEQFFLPLGKLAKDSAVMQRGWQTNSPSSTRQQQERTKPGQDKTKKN